MGNICNTENNNSIRNEKVRERTIYMKTEQSPISGKKNLSTESGMSSYLISEEYISDDSGNSKRTRHPGHASFR
jgi:hypothetical protein